MFRACIFTMILCVGAMLFVPRAWASNGTIRVVSLDWPPYTGKNLPEQGACSAVARAALKAVGYDLKVQFMPWRRAVRTARNNRLYSGYFPEYYAERVEKNFIFSDQIGFGPLGFVQRADDPVSWSRLRDLQGMRIGVVADYVNTAEFDKAVASGLLTVDPVIDDATNLRKLLRGRIRLAVIDPRVFNHLMSSDPDLRANRSLLEMNDRLLGGKELYMCFRRDAEGRQAAHLVNQGLSRINWRRMQEEYFKRISAGAE